MAHNVIRDIVQDIRTQSGFYSIITDEYTDIKNRTTHFLPGWVDKSLDAHEDFLGFYNIPNVSSETIASVIKDALVRLQRLRGQRYDVASNMLGQKTGVAKRIQETQPKAHPTHCHAHSLNLSVKDATTRIKLLSDTMDTAREIATLIKYSPKRGHLLGEIKQNIEGEDSTTGGILKVCPTRWTVRASCFRRILDNYDALLEEWTLCLDTRLDTDVRGRIIGC